ncbi:MAG: GNAT family N-acetyltransferase [Verrucomicrobia bacterium]|nr:GNAT family N-acetyltransferase [Verrucomicrobiota bacterium]NBU10615.1 GNAT family N-acetyltransferase [Pseudomonadota bacterium]NDB74497.1 GNAT family N-acetyltransferase [Verrucomicrobiota bacterium]NDD37622.1 GNAT family N-acetyltransferase [Verrucomicrobiota bacterium]NDE97423.1 GNAT family N-acetyltransferase [Verrucomicrobiota bacterium]
MSITIRPYQPADLPVMQTITLASFPGISLDQTIEEKFGEQNGHDWRWRKARHIELETTANPAGAFVAEEAGRVIAYVTTTLDRMAGSGRIANLAVVAELRGRGVGRQLIQHALVWFRAQGLSYALIESMSHNEVGRGLYTSVGFQEIGQLVHYAMKL